MRGDRPVSTVDGKCQVLASLRMPCLLDGELADEHGAPVPDARVRVLQEAPDHAAERIALVVLVLTGQAPAVSTSLMLHAQAPTRATILCAE